MSDLMSDEKITANIKWVDSGVIWGKLSILPTRKGDLILIEDGNLSHLLNRFNGKNVFITVNEIVESSNYEEA